MEPQLGTGIDKPTALPAVKVHPDSDNISDRKPHPEATKHKNHDGSENNVEGLGARLSRSSSSSSSSSDKDKGHIHDPFDVSDLQSPEPPDAPQWSMVSASPRGGSGNLSSMDGFPRTPEWVMSNVSTPMKSPPVQEMGKGYDPNRIPSSIFSKPTTPNDWSVASNDSLFSIHMGNNSFSRDTAFLQGEECNNAVEANHKAYESNNCYTPNLPTVIETPRKNDSRTSNVYVRPGLEEELNETPKVVRGETGEANSKEKTTPANSPNGVRLSNSSNLSDGKGPRVSNESTKSCDSFAFPVLLPDGTKAGNSQKTAAEKPQTPEGQAQQEDPKPQAAAAEPQASASWFSCFNCWPARCC